MGAFFCRVSQTIALTSIAASSPIREELAAFPRLSSRPNSTLHQRNETRATSSIFDGYDGGSAGKRATAASNKAWQTGRSLSYGAGSSSSAAYGYHGGDYGYGYGNNGADSPLAKGQDRGRESSPYGTPVNDFGERKGRRELSRELVQAMDEQVNKRDVYRLISQSINQSIRGAVQSQSVLSELEAQNDEELDGVSAKVKLLKNVGFLLSLSFHDLFVSSFDGLARTVYAGLS